MYIDFKITTWERAEIDHPEDEQVVLDAIKNGKLNSQSDFIKLEFDCSWEFVTDTTEAMTPEENDGFSTVEVYNDKNMIIHANGKY